MYLQESFVTAKDYIFEELKLVLGSEASQKVALVGTMCDMESRKEVGYVFAKVSRACDSSALNQGYTCPCRSLQTLRRCCSLRSAVKMEETLNMHSWPWRHKYYSCKNDTTFVIKTLCILATRCLFPQCSYTIANTLYIIFCIHDLFCPCNSTHCMNWHNNV